MASWRKKFTRKSQRLSDTDEVLINNSVKYRKKLQAAISQIQRTKKATQRNLDTHDSEIHVARLVNDIGQLSDCKPLQEISSLIDSLAMRHQLSSRVFNEYAMNALQQSLHKLDDDLLHDFDRTKSVYEEATANHCSDHTNKQLLNKVQHEWSKHQKLAMTELKHGLSSYCDIGLYNLKIQMVMLEKLQSFVDQLPHDGNNTSAGLPDFTNKNLQTRREIDTMLRIMLDAAPHDSASLPNGKRPKFLSDQHTLSNTLFSPEITEAAARCHGQSLRQQNVHGIPQYPSIHPGASATASAHPTEHESMIVTPGTPQNHPFARTSDDDRLPSYTDLFIVPSSCKEGRVQRRSSRHHEQ